MDKYLLEILKEVNTIIIPGLGALTITNKGTGEIMFMSYLKHDDGKLSAHIAQKDGLEENEAKNLIAKYVREITATLDKGESYDMFKFGSFIKDGDDIDFKNWAEGDDSKPEAKTEVEKPKKTPILEEVVTKEEPEKEEEKPKTEKKETPKETPAKEVSEKKSAPKEKEAESKPVAPVTPKVESPKETKADKPKEDASKKEATPIIPIIKEPSEKQPVETKELNILEKEERAATAAKLNKLKEEKAKKKPKKKRSAGFWMLMILLVLIVASITVGGIYYDDVKQHIPFLADVEEEKDNNAIEEMAETLGLDDEEDSNAEEEEVQEEEVVSDEEEITEEITEDPVEEQAVETPVETQNNYGSHDLPFHLIAGSFSSEANATRLVEKLKTEGFPAKVLPGGGMHMVSIKSYATAADAQAGRSEVSSVAPKAWVLERR